MKVVGIGLNKTGTKTLGICFRHWGMQHSSCNREAFELWREAKHELLMRLVEKYDSFEDWPWPMIFRDIDKNFGGAKFILTRRKNPETWFTSLCKHAERKGPSEYREYIYGYAMPHQHRQHHIDVYINHLEMVRDYFRNRPGDYLEVCWEEGSGWYELSRFLGFEQPGTPFPHANKSPG